jgi:hypothetical protein
MKRIQQISLVLGLAVLAACNTQNPIATNPSEASRDPKAPGINKLVKASGPNAWDNIAQEGTALAGGKYTASFRVKGAGEVSFRLFEGSWSKNLANLPCIASSAWKTCSVVVTMGTNPKFTFNISNSGPASTPTFVDDAKLLDSSGKNILINSDFEAATIAPWWFGPAFTVITEDIGTPPPPPPPPPSTGTTVWKNVEVGGGGMVTGVVVHPKERNLVYARTDVGGIFRWNETTGSWIPLSDGFTKAQAGYFGVESLAVDPSDPNIVFAAVGNGKTGPDTQSALLKSIDRGTSWRILKTDIDIYGNNNWRASGERLAVDPNSSAVVYFGSREQGVWRSTNGGSSWSAVTTLPKGDAAQGVGFVAFDPTSGTAGAGSKRVWVGSKAMMRAQLGAGCSRLAMWLAQKFLVI